METYEVVYVIDTPDGPTDIATSRATITPGYTTVDDIPIMIALRRGVRPSDVRIIAKIKE